MRPEASEPSAIAPYAGLGDVHRALENPRSASKAYFEFLSRLERVKALGERHVLLKYEAEYRRRLAALPASPQVLQGVIRAESISRSLSNKPAGGRGLSLRSRSKPYIDIHIHFEFDSARLSPRTYEQLGEIATALKSYALRDQSIEIEGHTDNQGTSQYNYDLSFRRSSAVRQALIERGIEGTRLTVVGFGESQPITDNETEEGQQKNRRVTFVNKGKQ